jgi:hypothetical protein
MSKIIELRASGFARLVAVEIRPTGALVPITGKNSQGKSSVLNAIWTALKGRAVAPPEPIHDGADRAVLRLDIGDAVITREFTRGKLGEITTDLKVVGADGARITRKPQEWIDHTLAAVCFDPLSFARADPRGQYQILRQLVPGVDFDAMARTRQRAYDDRTTANRRRDDAQAQANAVQLPAGPEPAAVNTADLVLRLGDATEANSNRTAVLAEIQRARIEASRMEDEAERLRARAAGLENEAQAKHVQADKAEAELPAAIDTTEIRERLAGAEQVNNARLKFAERRAALANVETHDATSRRLTEEIAALDKQKADAIAAAKLPVDGLAFADDNTVLFNGHPLAAAGTAEKIRVSVAVGMALNPALRVVLVDEASELDSDSLAMVEKMAIERGFQVWLAVVNESGAAGFHIVDGRVAAKGGEA